jgi:hypothetical protein
MGMSVTPVYPPQRRDRAGSSHFRDRELTTGFDPKAASGAPVTLK